MTEYVTAVTCACDTSPRTLAYVPDGPARNAGIARRLVLSPATVRNYVSAIFAKLQVAHRAEAIVKARRAGLGGPGPNS
jgi:DNA-binding CsgD family transcriptional regulator